jgi:predicted nuclease of predicted toxin-antitoxin system
MSLRILIDMNLSPDWVPVLQEAGWQQFIGQISEIHVHQTG